MDSCLCRLWNDVQLRSRSVSVICDGAIMPRVRRSISALCRSRALQYGHALAGLRPDFGCGGGGPPDVGSQGFKRWCVTVISPPMLFINFLARLCGVTIYDDYRESLHWLFAVDESMF